MTNDIGKYIKAGFSGLWITTFEAEEVVRSLAKLCVKEGWELLEWDIVQGQTSYDQLGQPANPDSSYANDPRPPLAKPSPKDKHQLVVLHNFDSYLGTSSIRQALINALILGKKLQVTYVILTNEHTIPSSLEKRFVLLDHPLPDDGELQGIAQDLLEDLELEQEEEGFKQSVSSAKGMTRMEAENAFALSIVETGVLTPDKIWKLKKQSVAKSECLSLHSGDENFNDIGGMQELKTFCLSLLQSERQDIKTKGVLITGLSGAGKSLFAKALGNESQRPTFLLDIGSAYHKHVGETGRRIREALKTIDASGPCIVLIDELEKALAGAGTGGAGDSGVSEGLFGTLLTWLNDKGKDPFVIGTSNDIRKLPPEFSRQERFDAIFFADFPDRKEKDAIWKVHLNKYHPDLKLENFEVNDDRWTGAEIEGCCRLSALLGKSVEEQANITVPLAKSRAEEIKEIRKEAEGRFLSTSYPGVFRLSNFQPYQQSGTVAKRRAVQRNEEPK